MGSGFKKHYGSGQLTLSGQTIPQHLGHVANFWIVSIRNRHSVMCHFPGNSAWPRKRPLETNRGGITVLR